MDILNLVFSGKVSIAYTIAMIVVLVFLLIALITLLTGHWKVALVFGGLSLAGGYMLTKVLM